MLAMLATSLGSSLPRVIIIKDLVVPGHSDQAPNRIHNIQVGPSWTDPLVLFLRDGKLPEDKGKAKKI